MGATVTRLPPKKKEQLTKELREVRARVRGQLFYTMNLEPQSYSLDTIDEISSRDNISDEQVPKTRASGSAMEKWVH